MGYGALHHLESMPSEAKIISMKDYLYKKAIIGILHRPELFEEMKNYPSSVPAMRVVYDKRKEEADAEELRKRFYALSDHLD